MLSLQEITTADSVDLFSIMSENPESQVYVKNLKYWENFAKYAEENKHTELSWLVKNMAKDSIGFISFSRNKPMSDSLIKRKNLSWTEGDVTLSIYIKKAFQGSGLGKIILNKAVEKLPEQNRTIFASTYTSNEKANKFFKTEKFEKVGSGFVKGSHLTIYRKVYPVIHSL